MEDSNLNPPPTPGSEGPPPGEPGPGPGTNEPAGKGEAQTTATGKSIISQELDRIKAEKGAGQDASKPGEKPEAKAGDQSEADLEAVPEKADGYELPKLPEGTVIDAELSDRFKSRAHELGLNQKQYQSLVDLYATEIVGTPDKYAQAQVEQVIAWEKEWIKELEAAPTYKRDLKHAALAIAEFGDNELLEYFDATRAGSYPALFRFVAKAGAALAEPEMKGKTNVEGADPPLQDRIWGKKPAGK